jgi:hypothetical protein
MADVDSSPTTTSVVLVGASIFELYVASQAGRPDAPGRVRGSADAQHHAAALAAGVDVAVRRDDVVEAVCAVDHRPDGPRLGERGELGELGRADGCAACRHELAGALGETRRRDGTLQVGDDEEQRTTGRDRLLDPLEGRIADAFDDDVVPAAVAKSSTV